MGKTKEETPKTYTVRVTEHALQNLDIPVTLLISGTSL